jgi:hypothetical protein
MKYQPIITNKSIIFNLQKPKPEEFRSLKQQILKTP